MTFNDDMAEAIRRKLTTFLTADEAEAFMDELSRPSVDEQFASLKAWLVSRLDENDKRWDENDKRWRETERRFEEIDQGFARSAIRMEAIEGSIDLLARRDTINNDQIKANAAQVEHISRKVDKTSNDIDRMVARIDANNERIDKLAYWLVWAMVAVFTAVIAGMGVAASIAG